MNSKILLIIAALFFSIAARAQNGKIDSLQKVLLTQKEDTNKVNSLNALSRELINMADFDKAKQYATDAISLSQKIKFRKGEANAYNNIGLIYTILSNYPEALKNHFIALKIREEIGDKKGIAEGLKLLALIPVIISK